MVSLIIRAGVVRFIFMMTRLFVLILVICNVCVVNAQAPKDSIIKESDYGMIRTNINSQIEHSQTAINDHFNARVSYQCIGTRRFTLTANAQYNSFDVDLNENQLSGGYNPDDIGVNDIHITGQVGLTAQYNTRLWNKPIVGIGIMSTNWGEGGFQKVTATMMGILMLRANRDTQFGIGPIVLINSASKVPAFLAIMYRHRFNSRWALYVHGGIMGLDYTPTQNNLFAIGADIDSKQVYFKPHDASLPHKCLFSMSSFRPMLKYRHRLQRNFYVEAKAGVSLKMNAKITSATGTHEYIEISQKSRPFAQISVSYSL